MSPISQIQARVVVGVLAACYPHVMKLSLLMFTLDLEELSTVIHCWEYKTKGKMSEGIGREDLRG